MSVLKSVVGFVIAVAVAIFLLKIVFKISISVVGLLINAVVGGVVLWILNLVGIKIPINLLTAIITGFFGIPGVIILLALKYIFKVF